MQEGKKIQYHHQPPRQWATSTGGNHGPRRHRPKAVEEANRFHSAFYGRPLGSSGSAPAGIDAGRFGEKDEDGFPIRKKKPNRGNETRTPPQARTTPTTSAPTATPKNERLCMGGHRETIFSLSFSPDGRYMATASQDSSVCVWSVATNKLASQLTEGMDKDFECLRVAWMDADDGGDDRGNVHEGDENINEAKNYVLASGGADGMVQLWSGCCNIGDDGNDDDDKMTFRSIGRVDHYLLDADEDFETTGKEEDRPQIYALQFFRRETMECLLTSADGLIHLWRIVPSAPPTRCPPVRGFDEERRLGDRSSDGASAEELGDRRRAIEPYLNAQFSHLQDRSTYRFGGARNPDNDLFVFDARYCDRCQLFAVALSDGTCRILSIFVGDATGEEVDDGRSSYLAELCVLSLPPYIADGKFMTSVSWDDSGTRLATCLAGGRVVLWSLQSIPSPAYGGDGTTMVHVLHPSFISVLEGGHDAGRPVFGAKYCGGQNQELLMTYGADGKVCVWDSYSTGDVHSPICTLISRSDYPIYALDIASTGEGGATSTTMANATNGTSAGSTGSGGKMYMAVAGGGADGMFIGVPVYIYHVWEKFGVCLTCAS